MGHVLGEWSRFRPTDCEDFDESLSKIQQIGLCETIKRSSIG